MSITLQVLLVIASLCVLAYVLNSVIKGKLNIHYAMVWIIWGTMMVLFAMFPGIIVTIGDLAGVQVASNTVFLIFIFVLYCMTFYVYMKLSKHNEDIVNLNYEIANLKRRVEELERNKTSNN